MRIVLTQKVVDELIDLAADPYTMQVETGMPDQNKLRNFMRNENTLRLRKEYREKHNSRHPVDIPAPVIW